MTARLDPPTPRALRRRETTPVDRRTLPKLKKQKAKDEDARIASLRSKAVNDTTGQLAEFKNPDRALTERQRLFVKAWAEGESLSSAAYRAGYNQTNVAYRMARDPAILKLYHQEKALYEEASQMTRKRVMDGFLEAAEMAKLQADPTAMTGAWREVGKMCGYFAEVKSRVTIDINDNTAYARMNRMSDEDLLKLIENDPKTIEGEFREVLADE